mmetsp:Transcript_29196/g.76445  ORF Transcript_29196/g.76445 Transcript_29196/m.76445 type:complete len:457 (+) Transcript_29196:265-1635(+)
MALVGNAGLDLPGIFCQCSNEACGVLLKMGSDYKAGQVVRCPECSSPFTVPPESLTTTFLGNAGIDVDMGLAGQEVLSPFGGLLRQENTPDDERIGAIKKETLFRFPSPSAAELSSLLDIPEAEMLVSSSFGHCQQMRNLTPSLEATVSSLTGTGGSVPVSQIFQEDINDLARIGGVRETPPRPMKNTDLKEIKQSRDVTSTIAGDVAGDVFLAVNPSVDAMQMVIHPVAVEHTPPAVRPSAASQLSCRYCGKVFKKAGRLLTHERKHTGERPFSCTECAKSFRDSAALEGHIARQHREQPFHCKTCNKGFSSKRQLMIHGRVHTGEKPFQCVVCERKFSQEGNLHTHIRRHMVNFGLDPVTDALGAEVAGKKRCRLCSFIVDDETALKTHVKHHIKQGDLTKLQDHMSGSTWSYDVDYDECRHGSVTSIATDDSGRRDSMESVVSNNCLTNCSTT